ncbi:hypothetical protein [Rheinheimera tangshanensis]|uniref:Uncharacterized protein n=1 Tax=Rheinheimera tangshanensis TaxID=400153 RepID=A0A5C8LUW0_9GAMM|nr:hypothetical protein [Rheinheimera tangshanensis]TXK80507.1 hypothetical protein FU839_11140 [Rheinheimera tangshanensis]GGM60773.1 hypothetical protein GCM10010920_21770 [Rheinheimera tangshanensis]
MKKLSVVMAALLVASGAVMAQDEESSAGGSGAGTIGGIATGTIVAGAIAAGVLAAVVSNNRSDSAPDEEEVEEQTCATGFSGPVNGVCTGSTVTVTGTGTNTKTTTVAITRPAQ